MVVAQGPRFEFDIDTSRPLDPRRPLRRRVRRARMPWRFKPRAQGFQEGVECAGKRMRWNTPQSAQTKAAWFAKNCGPRRTAREFSTAGAEGGTLVGARRAEGLFDYGWGTDFPLTRREQKRLQEGTAVPDPLFAPPTHPHASNWIDDTLRRIRGTFGATQYQTPKGWLPFCPPGGSGITCSHPNGSVIWRKVGSDLTAQERELFLRTYCAPGVCLTGSAGVAPVGITETIAYSRPRNPGTAEKASCQPLPAVQAVVMDVPVPPPPAAGPPVTDWSCTGAEASCVGANCIVRGESRTMRWKQGVPWDVVNGWIAANCGPGA